MRVLVTGAAGFIGSHLCEALSERGDEIVAVDCFLDESYSADLKRENAQALQKVGNIRLVEHDIRRPLPDDVLDGVAALINLAAMPGLMKSWHDFTLYQSCNEGAVHQLLIQAERHEIGHFIQASTSSVYGAQAVGDEDCALKPVSPYGVTKLSGESLIGAYGSSFGVPYSILRYFSVYGPRQRPDMAFHIMTDKLLRDDVISIYGDGLQSRSNTFVSDVVAGTLATLDHGPVRGALNVAGGEEANLLEIIDLLEHLVGRKARVIHEAPRPGDQRRTFGSTTRARALLGYSPQVGIAEGLERQVRWHLLTRP